MLPSTSASGRVMRCCLLALLLPAVAAADAETDGSGGAAPEAEVHAELEVLRARVVAQEERIRGLEGQGGVLAEELEALRTLFAVPDERGLESAYGLGPAASKVYAKDRGLSIGGYGEVQLQGFVGDGSDGRQDTLDALRGVFYFGYKFNDWSLVNSEIEFEHGGAHEGEGEAILELFALDFLLDPRLNLRVGLVLVPMGFVNEIHEPVFFLGSDRPLVERTIIPSTWRENGAGVFGDLGDRFHYRMYVVNGFDALGFSDQGLRGGRQNGAEALGEHFAFVGRFDYDLLDVLTVGGSVYAGESGQNGVSAGEKVPDTPVVVFEGHTQLRWRGFHARLLYAETRVGDARALSGLVGRTVAERMVGYYGEVAYELLHWLRRDSSMSLQPFYRYERVDTQASVPSGLARTGNADRQVHTVGIGFEPHPQVVVKLDYSNIDGGGAGDLADVVQASVGFVF